MSEYTENPLETELETLEAIYVNELSVARKSDGSVDRIELLLHPATGHDTAKQYVCMTVVFMPGAKYPDEPPEIEIRNPRGFGEEEVASLVEDMILKAQESTGEVMLYTLIEMAKDSLTEGNIPHCPCVICLEHFHEHDSFHRTSCYHYFHTRCLHHYLMHATAQLEDEEKDASERRHLDVSSQDQDKVIICPVCRAALDEPSLAVADWTDEPQEEEEEKKFELSPEMKAQQQKMREVFERQKVKGGIIDLEQEKNKFLVNPEDRLPIRSPVPAQMTADIKNTTCKSFKMQDGEEGTEEKWWRNRGRLDDQTHSRRGRGRGRGEARSSNTSQEERSYHQKHRSSSWREERGKDSNNHPRGLRDSPVSRKENRDSGTDGHSQISKDSTEVTETLGAKSGLRTAKDLSEECDPDFRETDREKLRGGRGVRRDGGRGGEYGRGRGRNDGERRGRRGRGGRGHHYEDEWRETRTREFTRSGDVHEKYERKHAEEAADEETENSRRENQRQDEMNDTHRDRDSRNKSWDSTSRDRGRRGGQRGGTAGSRGRDRHGGSRSYHRNPLGAPDTSNKEIGEFYDEDNTDEPLRKDREHRGVMNRNRLAKGRVSDENEPGRAGHDEKRYDKGGRKITEYSHELEKWQDFENVHRQSPRDEKNVQEASDDHTEKCHEHSGKGREAKPSGAKGTAKRDSPRDQDGKVHKYGSSYHRREYRRHEHGEEWEESEEGGYRHPEQGTDFRSGNDHSKRRGAGYEHGRDRQNRPSRNYDSSRQKRRDADKIDEGDRQKEGATYQSGYDKGESGFRDKGSDKGKQPSSEENKSSEKGFSAKSHDEQDREQQHQQHQQRHHQRHGPQNQYQYQRQWRHHDRQGEGRERSDRQHRNQEVRNRIRNTDSQRSGSTRGDDSCPQAETQEDEETDMWNRQLNLRWRQLNFGYTGEKESTSRKEMASLPVNFEKKDYARSQSWTSDAANNDMSSRQQVYMRSCSSNAIDCGNGYGIAMTADIGHRAESELWDCARESTRDSSQINSYYIGYNEAEEEENWDDEIDPYAYERRLIRPEHRKEYDKLKKTDYDHYKEKVKDRAARRNALADEERRMRREAVQMQSSSEGADAAPAKPKKSVLELFKEKQKAKEEQAGSSKYESDLRGKEAVSHSAEQSVNALERPRSESDVRGGVTPARGDYSRSTSLEESQYDDAKANAAKAKGNVLPQAKDVDSIVWVGVKKKDNPPLDNNGREDWKSHSAKNAAKSDSVDDAFMDAWRRRQELEEKRRGKCEPEVAIVKSNSRTSSVSHDENSQHSSAASSNCDKKSKTAKPKTSKVFKKAPPLTFPIKSDTNIPLRASTSTTVSSQVSAAEEDNLSSSSSMSAVDNDERIKSVPLSFIKKFKKAPPLKFSRKNKESIPTTPATQNVSASLGATCQEDVNLQGYPLSCNTVSQGNKNDLMGDVKEDWEAECRPLSDTASFRQTTNTSMNQFQLPVNALDPSFLLMSSYLNGGMLSSDLFNGYSLGSVSNITTNPLCSQFYNSFTTGNLDVNDQLGMCMNDQYALNMLQVQAPQGNEQNSFE